MKTRDKERRERAAETPILEGLPDAAGIAVALRLSPVLAEHMHGLANFLLVDPFAGATITRGERELIATAASAANNCFFCMDAHGTFAAELLSRDGHPDPRQLVDGVKNGAADGLDDKMVALTILARRVAAAPRAVTRQDMGRARRAGATDQDIQLCILIAAAFCMYNRMVDGFRARTFDDEREYLPRAKEIARSGYGPAPARRAAAIAS